MLVSFSIGTFLSNYDVKCKKLSTCLYTPLYKNEQKWARNKSMEATLQLVLLSLICLRLTRHSLFSLFQIFVSIFSFLLFLLERSGRGMCSGQAIMANKDPSLIWLDSIFSKPSILLVLLFFNQKLFLHFIIEHNNIWSNPNEWHIPIVKTRDIVCIDWEWFYILYFAWQIKTSVMRPFCLVELISQDAATNAGVLSVYLTNILYHHPPSSVVHWHWKSVHSLCFIVRATCYD